MTTETYSTRAFCTALPTALPVELASSEGKRWIHFGLSFHLRQVFCSRECEKSPVKVDVIPQFNLIFDTSICKAEYRNFWWVMSCCWALLSLGKARQRTVVYSKVWLTGWAREISQDVPFFFVFRSKRMNSCRWRVGDGVSCRKLAWNVKKKWVAIFLVARDEDLAARW